MREAMCMSMYVYACSTHVHLTCMSILMVVCSLIGRAQGENEASLVFQHCFKDAQPPW